MEFMTINGTTLRNLEILQNQVSKHKGYLIQNGFEKKFGMKQQSVLSSAGETVLFLVGWPASHLLVIVLLTFLFGDYIGSFRACFLMIEAIWPS